MRRRVKVPPHLFAQNLEALLPKEPTEESGQSSPSLQDLEPAASQPVQFSRHAAARLQSRGIEISDQERERLAGAVDELEERGAKESLVLLDDRAYIVGIERRTVITVMPRSEAMGSIFTNIDSTFVAV